MQRILKTDKRGGTVDGQRGCIFSWACLIFRGARVRAGVEVADAADNQQAPPRQYPSDSRGGGQCPPVEIPVDGEREVALRHETRGLHVLAGVDGGTPEIERRDSGKHWNQATLRCKCGRVSNSQAVATSLILEEISR